MVSFIRKLVENLQDEIISNHLILVLRALIAYMHIFPAAARLLCQTAVFKFCTGSLKLISANLIHALSAGMETRLDKTETGVQSCQSYAAQHEDVQINLVSKPIYERVEEKKQSFQSGVFTKFAHFNLQYIHSDSLEAVYNTGRYFKFIELH